MNPPAAPLDTALADDMKLTPALVQELSQVAAAAAAAPSGGKGAIYQDACTRLGLSLATLHRALGQVVVRPERKRRTDAGLYELPRAEAQTISSYILEHYRGTGKRGITVGQALDDLRKNALVRAESINPASGCVTLLSESAVLRALKGYGLHWQALRSQPLAVAQSTPHPNHTWQIDASVPTIFYLDDDGTSPMPEHVFYKNKPENFARIERQRVTRFVITDHTSGAIKLRYYMGGESVANYAEFFIWAIALQPGHRDPMHGVPFQLMADPGSGLAGAFRNLVRRLNIKLIINAAGNPRAKGQVENAQNLIEMGFEHQFRSHRPANLADLNERAHLWAAHFNATAIHGRHGRTRIDKWSEIMPSQCRSAPPAQVCRELLTADHKECRVDNYGHVQFGGAGRQWDVHGVPGGVQAGQKIAITYNAYNDSEVFAVLVGADGHELLHPCPLVGRDVHGFAADARQIGDGYRALKDSAADQARKQANLQATGADTLAGAAKARKASGFEVFNGAVRFDHLQAELDAQPQRLARAAQPLQLHTRTTAQPVPARLLSHFEAAAALTALGCPASAERNAAILAYASGVPEDEVPAIKARLTLRAGLRVVNGGAP